MNLIWNALLMLAPLMLSAIAPQAWAQPDDCQLNLSQPILDFGLMNRAIRLDASIERNLGERRLSVSLSCSKPVDMSVFLRAMAASTERFRFTDLGSYQVRVRDGVLDGQSVELGLIAAVGQLPAEAASTLTWRPEHGIVPVRAGVAVQGRSFSVQLELTAWAQEQALNVRDAVKWETSALFDAVAAGRSRETRLKASFAPGACEPVLSNNGLVDFGKLSKNDLNPDRGTRLPPKTLTLRVSCDAPTHFALRMQDNRDGSAMVNSEIYYGLNVDHRNNKIGLYSLNFDPAHAMADSYARLYRTDSTTGGTAWSTASANPIPIGSNSYLGFTDRAGSNSGPVAIQHLTTSVAVEVVIAPTASLDLSTAIDLDGSGTIEIIYL